MKLPGTNSAHLTYCTNIHPGQTLDQIVSNLKKHVLRVKENLGAPLFGLGLWLPHQALEQLSEPGQIEIFKQFLTTNGLYVFTLNGFPYGEFHASPLKEKVYLPDWTDVRRQSYTDRLATNLAMLMPDMDNLTGSISTLPGGFSANIKGAADIARMADHMLQSAATLHYIHEQYGKSICLGFEPEPFCFLETVSQTVDFFKEYLFSKPAISRFALQLRIDPRQAEQSLHRHLGICYDACHFAVGFEDPADSLDAMQNAGIKIAKVQISAGLQVDELTPEAIDELKGFADDIYLHQVTEQKDGQINRYLDLPEALEQAEKDPAGRKWRVHFHVPLYQEKIGPFTNTHKFLNDLLPLLAQRQLTDHYEVETYTWDVLPRQYRWMNVEGALARELKWVQKRLGQ